MPTHKRTSITAPCACYGDAPLATVTDSDSRRPFFRGESPSVLLGWIKCQWLRGVCAPGPSQAARAVTVSPQGPARGPARPAARPGLWPGPPKRRPAYGPAPPKHEPRGSDRSDRAPPPRRPGAPARPPAPPTPGAELPPAARWRGRGPRTRTRRPWGASGGSAAFLNYPPALGAAGSGARARQRWIEQNDSADSGRTRRAVPRASQLPGSIGLGCESARAARAGTGSEAPSRPGLAIARLRATVVKALKSRTLFQGSGGGGDSRSQGPVHPVGVRCMQGAHRALACRCTGIRARFQVILLVCTGVQDR